MLHVDRDGRVPFALVAVLLLMSAGVSALYAEKLAEYDAVRRAREAQLVAIRTVSEEVHREFAAEVERLAVRAIAAGIDGLLNESRMSTAFSHELSGYVAGRFPRVERTVRVSVSDFDAVLHRVTQTASDASAELRSDRAPYFAVHGFVTYSLDQEGFEFSRNETLLRVVPLAAPFMEAQLEEASRSGRGALFGVGQTVSAILTSLAQFRVLGGVASAAMRETSTRDVIRPTDVELAVNLALLLEEIRLFRTFDRNAASEVDASHPVVTVPPGLPPPAAERGLASLLEKFSRGGSIDPVDIFALFERLDAQGVSLGAILAQAIASILEDIALKPLDYLGLTPLVDWFLAVRAGAEGTIDGFLRWLTGEPTREVEYVRQYVRELLVQTGAGSSFLGPSVAAIPGRAYEVPSDSSSVWINVPEHAFLVPFQFRDLLDRQLDSFWQSYYPILSGDVERIHAGARSWANGLAARLGEDAVLSGLLAETATGPIDPTDRETLLEGLAVRVRVAVDAAIARYRSSPETIETLMGELWTAAKAAIRGLVDHMISSYDLLAKASYEIARGTVAIVEDMLTIAAKDPDYGALDAAGIEALRAAIHADVDASGWSGASFGAKRAEDIARWLDAFGALDGTGLPSSSLLLERLREAAVGASGWLVLARDAVVRVVDGAVESERRAGRPRLVPALLGGFSFSDPTENSSPRTERFVVRHEPGRLRATEAPADAWERDVAPAGGLWVRIVDPAERPVDAETPNVHYTHPFARSERPFSTGWTVRVLSAVRLRAETVDRVLLGPSGLVPAALETVWPLRFEIEVATLSAWNLTGVAYLNSNTIFGDAWNALLGFLDAGWRDVLDAIAWLRDRERELVAKVVGGFETALSLARSVAVEMGRVAGEVLDFLDDAARGVEGFGGRLAASLVGLFPPNTTVTIRADGWSFRVTFNGGQGRLMIIEFDAGGAAGDVSLLDVLGGVPSRASGHSVGPPRSLGRKP